MTTSLNALAGAGGGILSMVLTYPLITLSTRAQVESKKAQSKFIDAVQKIVAREGIPGTVCGASTLRSLASASPTLSTTTGMSGPGPSSRRPLPRLAAPSKKLTTVESMIAGAIAGSATVIITNPIWVVNTRVTTRQQNSVADLESGKPAKKPTTLGTLMALLKNEGPQALFSGVLPALVLVVNPILQYTLFEQMKNYVEKRRKVTPTVAFFLGALGKLFATSVTYPYITVKSQMHVAGSQSNKKEGMTEALRRVIREEGYAGLYKGIGPKVTQSVLTAAFLFAFKDALYEQTVRLRQGRKA
ncbi:hypothetical protein J3459_011550 [Metarhizium acridum]|nr:hypothetical protein J3459_011550 [Metarhizium acridum]